MDASRIRTLTLDLDVLAKRLSVETTDEGERISEEVIEAATGLVLAVIGEGCNAPEITGAYVMGLTDPVIDAAHRIIEGGEDHAALRLAANNLLPEAFSATVTRIERTKPTPAPEIAPELI